MTASTSYQLELNAEQILALHRIARATVDLSDDAGEADITAAQEPLLWLDGMAAKISAAGDATYAVGTAVEILGEDGTPSGYTGKVAETYLNENLAWEYEVRLDRPISSRTHYPYRETELVERSTR